MLNLGAEPFCAGRSSFLEAPAGNGEKSAKLFVTLRIGDIETVAQLDTGAAWSILTSELAEVLNLFGGSGPATSISTRIGQIYGTLERVGMTFVASDGESLEIEGTVFVSREWSAGTFVGWAGMLERVRFAVDPRENYFYFGVG